jgi:dipeptidyl aminopeptidase/acylaminoacyl peptidase
MASSRILSLACLILAHKRPIGGPQAALQDQWSTRWNLNVWASAGYVVFAPNPTGSTTFGQALTDGIVGDWGGAPFDDMRAGWTKLLEEYPEIDKSRAIGTSSSIYIDSK